MLKLDLRLIVKKLDKKLSEIIKEDLPLLKKVKEHVIDSGGKRIRPLTHYFFTVLLGYKGQKWEAVFP
jgi:octaprenyl-diphosphate synthase